MNRLYKTFILLTMIIFFACQKEDSPIEAPEPGPTPPVKSIKYPEKEMRAVWLATVDKIDWPSTSISSIQKDEFIQYLDLFKKNNINVVFVQIRPCADAFYKSDLEPWSSYITGVLGKDPGYNVLQFMIDETHKRGLEFHAWFNPYRISNNASKFVPVRGSVPDVHPEWTMKYSNLLLFRPAIPEVRQHFLNVVDDVLKNYEIDGVHIDDYFYPYPVAGLVLDDLDDYNTYGKAYSSIDDFRRANVNKMIQDLHEMLTNKYPQVLFSVSPYYQYEYNRDKLYADIKLWCEKNWVDCIIPQLYYSASFTSQSTWWGNNSNDVPVVVGQALYMFSSNSSDTPFQKVDELIRQMNIIRGYKKLKGSAFFSANSLRSNSLRVTTTLYEKYYQNQALVPYMGPKNATFPSPVENFRVGGEELLWQSSVNNLRYAIYFVDDSLNATLVTVTKEDHYKPTKSGTYIISSITKDNLESKYSEPISFVK